MTTTPETRTNTETTAGDEHPHGLWEEPGAARRLQLLRAAKSVAIVGMSDKPARASYFVATYLTSDSSYQLYYVNPRITEVLGEPGYASLQDLPEAPDIVVAFRKPADLPALAEEAAAVGAQTLWVQLGIHSAEAMQRATDLGINAVQDRCIKIEHGRFHGNLHLGGFDTGVISAKRQQLDG
ncbi:CoA-binding protein [Nesterenkonia sp. HG001]|uniref:CoA-binding protein n=1 Tax=Nesterenkonia sp. HG001 TaxID=2983207 RepID=UPI002AC3D0B3|nr:CoA-binding protein [Nesterenkonia sp. HG001]MDZ5077459.1 CoA-binding protein [Nesterenkonia sp. HG001]